MIATWSAIEQVEQMPTRRASEVYFAIAITIGAVIFALT